MVRTRAVRCTEGTLLVDRAKFDRLMGVDIWAMVVREIENTGGAS